LQHGWWSPQLGATSLLPAGAAGFGSQQLASTSTGTAQLEEILGNVPAVDTQPPVPADNLSSSSSSSSSASAVQTADSPASAQDLHQALLSAGLQYSTVMAVVKVATNYHLMPSKPQVLAERAAELVGYFGPPLANKVLRQVSISSISSGTGSAVGRTDIIKTATAAEAAAVEAAAIAASNVHLSSNTSSSRGVQTVAHALLETFCCVLRL
jgi:hypothetical protein